MNRKRTLYLLTLLAAFVWMAQNGAAQDAPKLVQDPRIAAALQDISANRIQETIEKLVRFGTGSTLSAQDPDSIAKGQGIGAAREWIKAEFEQYAKDCGGCLEVKTHVFTEPAADRIPAPTELTNVYAVLKGTDAAQAKRIVLMTGHYALEG